ncbi:phage integrase central domain-containing protein [Sphingomonas chungangi]|uniref:phage integrase central domain-containing protein n=1 Tax=Sphingomonas chungangi TaxID=2683589 RepID=UPI003CCDA902
MAFGKLPVVDIDSRTILAALRKIEQRGSIETAKRVRGYVFAIFERAIGDCLLDKEVNPAARIAKSLKKNARRREAAGAYRSLGLDRASTGCRSRPGADDHQAGLPLPCTDDGSGRRTP